MAAEAACGRLPYGRALYAWYQGTCDSTCDVERLIRIVKQPMKVKHADISASLLRDAVTVTAFGPKTKAALATRTICPISQTVHLVPTPFLITCDEIWRKHFGRRYSVNLAQRSDCGKAKE